MACVYKEIAIAALAEHVWAAVRDVGAEVMKQTLESSWQHAAVKGK